MSFTKALEFLKQSEKHSIWRNDLPGMVTMRNGELLYLDFEMKTHPLMFSTVTVTDTLANDWQIAILGD